MYRYKINNFRLVAFFVKWLVLMTKELFARGC